MIGRINSVQTLGTLDGPGVRFVLFMQGCPLRCVYCHNPDTWNITGGQLRSAEDVFSSIKRYKEYYGENGGITVSGGEPLLQADFVYELFSLCKNDGIHTALDTSGCLWNESVERLLSVTDLCLLDYKMTNAEDYKKYTLAEKESVDFFLARLKEKNIPTWLRHVVVKGLNDTSESISALYEIAKSHENVKKVELLKFRKLCAPKYDNLGIPFKLKDTPETTDADIQNLLDGVNTYNL